MLWCMARFSEGQKVGEIARDGMACHRASMLVCWPGEVREGYVVASTMAGCI